MTDVSDLGKSEEQLREIAERFERNWRTALAKQSKEVELAEANGFIEGQEIVANAIAGLLSDCGPTDVDAVIGFVGGGGLSRDPVAAVIARREYGAVLPSWGPGVDAVAWNLKFYGRLAAAFTKAGVAL